MRARSARVGVVLEDEGMQGAGVTMTERCDKSSVNRPETIREIRLGKTRDGTLGLANGRMNPLPFCPAFRKPGCAGHYSPPPEPIVRSGAVS